MKRFSLFICALASLVVVSAGSVTYAAPKTAAPVPQKPAAAAAPQTQDPKDDPTGPGKPIHFIGNSFVMWGGKTIEIAGYDPDKKAATGAILISPPWNEGGVSICAEGAITKDKHDCLDVGKAAVQSPTLKASKVDLSAATTNTGLGFTAPQSAADIRKGLKSDSPVQLYACTDCTVTTPGGWFSKALTKKVKLVVSQGTDLTTVDGEKIN